MGEGLWYLNTIIASQTFILTDYTLFYIGRLFLFGFLFR